MARRITTDTSVPEQAGNRPARPRRKRRQQGIRLSAGLLIRLISIAAMAAVLILLILRPI